MSASEHARSGMNPEVYYSAHLKPCAGRGESWSAIVRFLQEWIPAEGAVLEVGAGYCDFINRVRARRRCAVDVSEIVHRSAGPGVEAYVRPCWDLGNFADQSLDVVFASNVFEHLTRDQLRLSLAEIFRVLGRAGKLLVIQPNFRYAYRYYFDDLTHETVLSHVSFGAFLRAAGFEILRLQKRFLPYSHGCVPFRIPAWLVGLYLRLPYKPFAHQMFVVASPSARNP